MMEIRQKLRMAAGVIAAFVLFVPGKALAAPHRGAPAGRGSVHFVAPRRDVHVHAGPASRGSVHFAPPIAPRWAYPVVHPRYAPEYFRRFRPGYRTLLIGPDTYYWYPALPVGCQATVTVAGQYYYFCDGIYYLPYLYEGATVYVAVPPPA